MPVFDSTEATSYYDTVPTSNSYYYSVSAVETGGYEGTHSSCVSRKVQILPAPSGFSVASGTRVSSISMSWSSVSGARGYIIYRSADQGDTYEPVDTVSWNSYIDSTVSTDTYYYRVAAYNERGIGTMSSYKTGYTLRPPTLKATSSTSSTIELSWSTVSSAQMFYIYRGTTTTSLVLTDSTTQNTFSDVPPEYKEYYYCLTMRISGEVTLPGKIVSAARLRREPTGLTVTELENGCLIMWDNYPGADRYLLSRTATSTGTNTYRVVTDTFYRDITTSTTKFYYKIAAEVDSSLSPYTGTIRAGALQLPMTPVAIAANGTAAGIRISWEMSENSSMPSGYIILRGAQSPENVVFLDSTTETIYFDSVADTLHYYYQIAAYNNKGIGTFSQPYSAKRLPPGFPSTINPSNGYFASKIVIDWSSVPGVTGYRCYRSTATSGSYELIGTTTGTQLIDTTCLPNKWYFYKVSSFIDSLLASPMSSAWSGARIGPPETISVSSLVTGVRCTWPELPIAIKVAQYNVYRSNSPTGPFVKIGNATGSATSWFDTTVPNGNNYYRVTAQNMEETTPGPVSTAAHLLYPFTPASIAATKGTQPGIISVSWGSAIGAAGYHLYRGTIYGAKTGLVLRATIPDTLFHDTVATDSMYFYRVKAFNNGGESSLSGTFAAGFRQPSTAPGPPSNVATVSVNNSIRISWDPPSSKTGYTGFTIYRSPNQDGSDSTEIQTTVLYYDDQPPLSFPTQYWYRVTAVNQNGKSDFSEAVTGARE